MKLYTIYDKLAEQSGPIFEDSNDMTAIRTFHAVIKQNKDDYDLYSLGEYNRNTCEITFNKEVIFFLRPKEPQLNLIEGV